MNTKKMAIIKGNCPLICLFIFIVFFVACEEKLSPEDQISKGEEPRIKTIYPESLFVVNKTLYFSDGRRFFCTFQDWDHFYELRGNKNPPKGLLDYKQLPTGMKFIKKCNLGILTKKFFD